MDRPTIYAYYMFCAVKTLQSSILSTNILILVHLGNKHSDYFFSKLHSMSLC